MEDLVIKGADCTPEVFLSIDGEISIKGRSYIEDPDFFYEPIIQWCKKVKAPEVYINLWINYANTPSSKSLFEVIRTIEKNKRIESIYLTWYYEEEDIEMLESFKIIEDITQRISFRYVAVDSMEMCRV